MRIDLSTSSAQELDRAIQRLADASGEVVKDTLTKQARLLCVDFALNTRPLEKGKGGKEKAEENIKNKILSIYVPVGVGFEILETHKVGYGAAFLRMIKAGNTGQAALYLSKYSRKNFTVGMFDGGTLHKEQAFKGRTSKRMIVLNFDSAVKKYIKTIIKRVGYAKGGFATAARELGGTRGIPGFASRHTSAPGKGTVEGNGKTLIVTIENGVKYARLALTPEKEEKALDFRKRQIESVLGRMMTSRARSVSSSLR